MIDYNFILKQRKMFSRRNGDSVMGQSPVQTIQFSSLKKKGDDQCLNFCKIDGKENEFKIKKSLNSFMTIIVVNSFLNLNRPKKLKNQKQKVFNGLIIQNIPRQFFNYQHENTLQQLWNLVKQKSKTIEEIEALLNNYPIAQFVLQCYARKMIRDYIDQSLGLDLFGNEEKIISDYQSEVRGQLLGYLANVLKMEITIIHLEGDKNQERFQENFGNIDAPWKVDIYDEVDFYRFCVQQVEKSHKLLSISSSTNIYHPPQKKKLVHQNTESEVTETTAQGQSHPRMQVESKSANKDHMYRCRTCGSKVRFCECEQKKKGNTPRQINNTNTPNRSLFNGLAFERPVVSRRREDLSAKLCHSCSRLACICKK